MLRVVTSESMKPRPCFQALIHRFSHFCHLFTCCHFYYRITISPFTIHITCILPSLRRTSAPIQLTIVLGVLGTQETSCILIAGLLERDIFDLYLAEFDKPWVTHLRENCRCSTNLCAWRPNTSTRIETCSRHQTNFLRRCQGGKVNDTHTPATKLISGSVAGEVSA